MSDTLAPLSPIQQLAAEGLTKFFNAPGEGNVQAPLAETKVSRVETSLASGGRDLLDGTANESISITLSHPQLDLQPAEVAKLALKALSTAEPLANAASFETEAQHAITLKKKLEEFIAKGADLPKELLNWSGFDPEKLEQWNGVPDHAISGIGSFTKGVEFFIPVAENKKDQEAKVAPYEVVEQDIKTRDATIKATIAEREAILEGIKDKETKQVVKGKEADWAKLEAEAKLLHISVQKEEMGGRYSDNRQKSLKVLVSSPKQVDFFKEQAPNANAIVEDSKVKELTDSNMLSRLSDEQRGKVIGRAFNSDKILELAGGRKDIQAAIVKSLKRWAGTDKTKMDEVASFTNDDAFKEHQNWFKTASEIKVEGKPKELPRVNTDNKGNLVIDITVQAGQAGEIIRKIAAMKAPAQATSTQLAAAAPTNDAAGIAKQIIASQNPAQNWASATDTANIAAGQGR